MERRIIHLFDESGRPTDSLYLLRLRPDSYRFSIGYQAGQPLSLTDWQRLTGSLVVVNGGFFTPEFTATGLVIVDGRPTGSSYRGFGGMFAVSASGPALRSLLSQPYESGEPLLYALQSFPLLVKPGGQEGYEDDHGPSDRRTVIAQDRDGRFLFLVTQWGGFTLHELSRYLLSSDLDLDIALNLDGGASSGILLKEPDEGVPSFSLLPSVIMITPR